MKMCCINHVFTEFLNSACENSATADFIVQKFFQVVIVFIIHKLVFRRYKLMFYSTMYKNRGKSFAEILNCGRLQNCGWLWNNFATYRTQPSKRQVESQVK